MELIIRTIASEPTKTACVLRTKQNVYRIRSRLGKKLTEIYVKLIKDEVKWNTHIS